MDVVALVKKAQAGDKEALVELIMRQKQDYYRLAYTYMGNQDDALDVMEDMIIRLYDNITGLKKPIAFYSWSKTILVNVCRKRLREKKHLYFHDCQDESIEPVAKEYEQLDRQIILERHLANLSKKQQEVLKLRYYMDLDYKEIAEILKIPLGTVKSRISIGLKKLAQSMGGEGLE